LIAQNISNYWGSGNLEIEKRIQDLMFPEGVSLDVKNRVSNQKIGCSIFL